LKDDEGFQEMEGMADEGEQKVKGWSDDNNHKAIVQHTTDIKKDVASGKCDLWKKAFRKISAMQGEARMSEDHLLS
jgi:hypothetical protein